MRVRILTGRTNPLFDAGVVRLSLLFSLGKTIFDSVAPHRVSFILSNNYALLSDQTEKLTTNLQIEGGKLTSQNAKKLRFVYTLKRSDLSRTKQQENQSESYSGL